MTTARVVFHDPETGVEIDSYAYDSIYDCGSLDGIDLIHSVIGIDVDPAALAARIEDDSSFRRALLALVYEPLFAGMNCGAFDAIAEARVQEAQDMCRTVEARIACEEALQECLP